MIDLHCDTIMKITDEPQQGDLFHNPWQIDIEKLQKSNALVQDFALFVNLKQLRNSTTPYERYQEMLQVYQNNVKKYIKYLQPIFSYADFTSLTKTNKIGTLLSVEEGGVFEGDLRKLEKAYEEGVRLITLTWNYPNGLGFPHLSEYDGQGLTAKGIEFVECMQELGMIVDSSHLNDAGTYQLLDIMDKPFVASHSNARSLKAHSRNLSDTLIKGIGNKGGVIGLNFSNHFLGDTEESKVADLVRHGLYIRNIGGSDVLVLGTDFDGIQPTTEIKDASEMEKLYKAFLAAGLSEEEVDKIFWKNASRVFREILS